MNSFNSFSTWWEIFPKQGNLNEKYWEGFFLIHECLRSKRFVEKLPDAHIDEGRWIFISQRCVFDETKFYICLRIRVADGIGAMKKGVC